MVGGVGMLEAQVLGAARGVRSFGDIAVLYRTRRQAALLEECLAHDGIPCVVTGPGGFPVGRGGAGRAGLAGGAAGGRESPPPPSWRSGRPTTPPSGGVERLRNMAVFFGDVTAFLRNLTIGQGRGSAAPGRAELCRRSGDPLHPPRGQGTGVAGGVPVRRWGGPHSAGAGRAWTPMRLRSGGCSMWV